MWLATTMFVLITLVSVVIRGNISRFMECVIVRITITASRERERERERESIPLIKKGLRYYSIPVVL